MITLTPKQEEVILSKSQHKILNWGRRSGKTTVFAYEALGTALTIPNAKITYYAQTFGDARDIAWDIFLEAFGDSVVNKNQTLLEIIVANDKGGTSKITLRGWESVVTSNKGRGTENDLILCDEIAFCRGFIEYYNKVLDPTLLTTTGRFVGASTPNGFNDFYELANRSQTNPDWFYSHATSYDNPFNSSEWLEDKKKEIPQDSFEQEYMADFRKMEGLVYKEFNRGRHLFDEMEIAETDYLGGVDFGYSNCAGVVSIKKDRRGTYWVIDEFYEKERTDAQVAEYVSAKNYLKVYPDPESPGAIQELKNRKVNVRDVIKGKDSIKLGVNKVRDLLRQGRLKISKSCINLIWELETYHYPITIGERGESENPVKENDHLLDALRYVVMMDSTTVEIKNYDSWIGSFRKDEEPANPAL